MAAKKKPGLRLQKQVDTSLLVPVWSDIDIGPMPQSEEDNDGYGERYNALQKAEARASHYAINMRPRLLARWAGIAAKLVVEQFGPDGEFANKIPAFVYRGSSGVTVATALSQALVHHDYEFVFGLVYTRKEYEKSHGAKIEVYNEVVLKEKPKDVIFVFVDDFVASGDTFRAAMRAVRNATNATVYHSLRGIVFNEQAVRTLLTEGVGEFAKLQPWRYTF